MSIAKSIQEASLAALSLVFAAIGGALGLVLMLVMEGWITIPVGAVAGLYVALFLAYHNVAGQHRQLLAATGRNKPELVAALLPKYRYVIHELANRMKACKTEDDHAKWKADMQAWERETKALLEQHCEDAEVSSFWDFTRADLAAYGTLHKDAKINMRYQSAQFRIAALRRIMNNYSERPVF